MQRETEDGDRITTRYGRGRAKLTMVMIQYRRWCVFVVYNVLALRIDVVSGTILAPLTVGVDAVTRRVVL